MVSKQVRVVVVGLALVCTLSAVVPTARAQAPAAQAFQALPINPAIADNQCALTDAGKNLQKQYMAVLKGQFNPPWDDNAKKILDDWYKGYWFLSMTHEVNRSKLPEFRTQLIERDIRTAKNKPAVQYLFGLTLAGTKSFAQSTKYHPAVRYNAMLILGDLNEVERGVRNEATGLQAAFPDPLPAALDILVAEYQSPTQIDAVRVAAMVGILRHAKLDWTRSRDRQIPGAKRKEILDAMLALLSSTPPAGRSANGHVWMQRRGIEIVSALGAIGRVPEANKTLAMIVSDGKADFSLRLAAAEALSLSPADAPPPLALDVPTFARQLGGLAAQACSAEVTRLAAVEKREKEKESVRTLLAAVIANPFQVIDNTSSSEGMQQEGMYSSMPDMSQMVESYGSSEMMMFGSGGMLGAAAGVSAPTDPLVNLSRRRLKGQLVLLKNALTKLSALVKADAQKVQAVDVVTTAVSDALAATDPPTGEQDVKGMKKSLETGMKKLKPFAVVAKAADPLVDALAAPTEPDPATPMPEAAPAAAAPPTATPDAATPGAEPAAVAPDAAAINPAPAPAAAPALPAAAPAAPGT